MHSICRERPALRHPSRTTVRTNAVVRDAANTTLKPITANAANKQARHAVPTARLCEFRPGARAEDGAAALLVSSVVEASGAPGLKVVPLVRHNERVSCSPLGWWFGVVVEK